MLGTLNASYEKGSERPGTEEALRVARETFDILFDHAPVMLHSVDVGGRLVKVNRRWLQGLGYEREEVLGRKSIDFLTEESRAMAISDTLPLFWRVGSARSVGHQFVRKDGEPLEVLLDAEVIHSTAEDRSTLAALRTGNDLVQWKQASTTLMALQQLARIQDSLTSILSNQGSDGSAPDPPPLHQYPDPTPENGSWREYLGTLLEIGHDISGNLRALVRTHEEWLDASVEQQRELLLAAKGMEKTIAELKGTVADCRMHQ